LLITHSLGSIFRARILAIACGYEDADDLDHLRKDPAFKLACGRLPDTGDDLCSQPTMSRWENAPTLREIVKRAASSSIFIAPVRPRRTSRHARHRATPAMSRMAISNCRVQCALR